MDIRILNIIIPILAELEDVSISKLEKASIKEIKRINTEKPLEDYICHKDSTSSLTFSVKNQGRIKETLITSTSLESQLFQKAVKEYSTSIDKINFPLILESKAGEKYEFVNLDLLLDKLSEIGKKGYSIQRYKGLGEMNPEQLWETTLDPSLRVLREVTIAEVEDIEQDTKERNLFEDLMGDQVEPRKKIIEDNALYVSNLDI